ncbi:MAG: hypothetical protein V4613_02390 [Bacteroidota bacterium]
MKTLYILAPLLLLMGCNISNDRSINSNDSSQIESLKKSQLINLDSTKKPLNGQPSFVNGGVENLPEEGVVNFDYDKYYPGILDTVKERRITMANKVNMKPGKGITVTILANTSTSEQMFLCTHDSTSKLIDTYYIGISTMYDNGRAYTINKNIINNNTIAFDHVDYRERIGAKEMIMDTFNHFVKTIKINRLGRMTEK